MNEAIKLPARLSAAQRALVDSPESERLVTWAVDRGIRRWPTAEPAELAALAREALVLAAQSYRPGEASFWTYAEKRVMGHILDHLLKEAMALAPSLVRIVRAHGVLRAQLRRERTSPDDSPPDAWARLHARCARVATEMLLTTRLDAIDPETRLVWSDEQMRTVEAIREARTALSPNEDRLVERHYVEHVPLKDVGDELGVSYRTVKRMHHKVRAQLRRALVARGITAFVALDPT